MSAKVGVAAAAVLALLVACSSAHEEARAGDGLDLGDAAAPPVDAAISDSEADAADAGPPPGYVPGYVTNVVSFTPGPCAGFGQAAMPGVVEGPPHGGGDAQGSLDVVSLGNGGSVVLSFDPYVIVDGPGVDFIVYENPFYPGGDATEPPYAEPGEVSVSADGVTWATYPCTATKPPYGECAGWHPVLPAATTSCEPENGGDAYDLAELGLSEVRYVRIVDKAGETCVNGMTSNGFDLDAVGARNFR